MSKWNQYMDNSGNFQFANYVYKTINDLMKNALDMGTLLSDDPHKLRAYKEQTKKLFKSKWYELAECMEAMDIIQKCPCQNDAKEVYCEVCKGARYIVSEFLSADTIREVSIVTSNQNEEISRKLQAALMQVLNEVSSL
jgi:hypothetical protein